MPWLAATVLANLLLRRILSGLTQPDGGQMLLDGNAYTPNSKGEAEASGTVMVLQELNVIGDFERGRKPISQPSAKSRGLDKCWQPAATSN